METVTETLKPFATLDEMAQAYAEEWNNNIACDEYDLTDAESVKDFAVEQMHRTAILQLHGVSISDKMTSYIRHFGYVARGQGNNG